MLTREKKKEQIDKFSEKLNGAEIVVIAENKGLTVSELNALRQNIKKSDGGSLQVVKNNLAAIALRDKGFGQIADSLSGPLIYGVGADPAAVSKGFSTAAKKLEKLQIRGAVLANNECIDEQGVKSIAELPSKEQLLAQLLGTMQMPIVGFVRTLSAVPSGFVRALAAHRDNIDQ